MKLAANRLLDTVDTKLQPLPDFPELGVSRDDIRPGLRMIVIGDYLVLYQLQPGLIEIVRVVHGHRDLGALA
jgi:toxin ParE1/3/4